MSSQERLWRKLEAVPGLSTSRIEWAALLGDELTLLGPFLRPTGAVAASYPCPNRAKPGCTHNVVEHGPDDFVGVCPEGCPTVALRRSDILIYEVDLGRLGAATATALGAVPDDQGFADAALTHRVGTFSPTAGYRFPVYLTVQIEPEALLHALEKLASRHGEPFILVAPTHDPRSPTADALIETKRVCFLALAEGFQLGSDGRLCAAAPARDALARFSESILPSREDDSGMAFFRTPAGATWENVSIKFKDGHTVSVRVGKVTGVYHYSEMGMADRRNADPTRQWALLYSFAKGHGTLDWNHPDASPRNQKRRESLASDFRDFFRIDGDPIEHDAESKGWRTRFAVEPN